MIQDILALTIVGCAVAYTGFSFYRILFSTEKQSFGCSGCVSSANCELKELKK